MKHPIALILLSLCCCLLCVNCAAEKPPGGGPPDTDPPFLVSSSFESGSTRVDSMMVMEFEFSEPLSPPSVSRSIRIFPLGRHDADMRVRGRKIQITPKTPWEDDLVYTVILGKTISDLRNNQMTAPVQLSFTRGNEMPHNTIRGFVSGLKSGTAATIHISRLVSHPDSVLARPEYLTQSDGEGYFSFEYLPADTFFIAAYLDLNKSNTYDRLSDGVCVPSRPWIVPDTLRDRSVDLLAIHDNLLPPRLLRASSICPDRTQLEFTKDPAPWNAPGVFTIAQGHIDTVLYDQKTCTIFHTPLSGDSLYLWIKGLKDYLACTLKDTSFSVPVNAFKDTLYAFEQKHQTLFITPLPGADRLRGIFKSRTDTLDIELTQKAHGLYAVPYAPVAVRGNWHVSMPFNAFFPGIVVDSTYTVPLQLSAPPEYSAVNGLLEMPVPQDYRLVLENTAGNRYETFSDGHTFSFTDVVAGTYTLSWYRDRNGNKRPDPGRPYPYKRPEIVYPLEKGIQVRARWDVELSDPYKIPVENEE